MILSQARARVGATPVLNPLSHHHHVSPVGGASCIIPRTVAPSESLGLGLVLAQVHRPRSRDADDVGRIDQQGVLMVASGAQDVSVVEQTQVDQLRGGVGADRGIGPTS